MGMNGGGNVMTYYAGGQTKKEARRAKEDANKHFEEKETARYREAVASLGKEAREVRTRRKGQRYEAKRTCDAKMAATKDKTKGKPPHRRRAEVAKTRTDCAFDVMNVEEHAAQEIEYERGGFIIWGFKQQVDAYSNVVQGFVPDRTLPMSSFQFKRVSLS